jgi:autoinducer 2-degrading protein
MTRRVIMTVTCVHVLVEEEHIDDFIRASTENHLDSIQEPGNLRFDVLQAADNPGSFLLYEAYESEEAAAAHKHTAHYLKWRKTVADWMAEPRRGVKYTAHCP